MADLRGARVGVLEARMGTELGNLIRRHGGEARVAPSVREAPLDASGPVTELVEALGRGEIDIVVFMTGVGTEALFREADGLGRLDELLAALRETTNVSRGQKPWSPLKRNGVPISVTVPEPYTTADVLETLRRLSPRGKRVAVAQYGERSAAITDALRGWGASVLELCLYEWQLPEDTGPLEALVRAVIAGELDVVAFTSQVQVRHLLLVAERLGCADELVRALNARTVVAAVGPTCAAALVEAGIPPRVVPEHPKMGPMVLALAEYLESRGTPPADSDSTISHA